MWVTTGLIPVTAGLVLAAQHREVPGHINQEDTKWVLSANEYYSEKNQVNDFR